jgi:hypothetical protein
MSLPELGLDDLQCEGEQELLVVKDIGGIKIEGNEIGGGSY